MVIVFHMTRRWRSCFTWHAGGDRVSNNTQVVIVFHITRRWWSCSTWHAGGDRVPHNTQVVIVFHIPYITRNDGCHSVQHCRSRLHISLHCHGYSKGESRGQPVPDRNTNQAFLQLTFSLAWHPIGQIRGCAFWHLSLTNNIRVESWMSLEPSCFASNIRWWMSSQFIDHFPFPGLLLVTGTRSIGFLRYRTGFNSQSSYRQLWAFPLR